MENRYERKMNSAIAQIKGMREDELFECAKQLPLSTIHSVDDNRSFSFTSICYVRLSAPLTNPPLPQPFYTYRKLTTTVSPDFLDIDFCRC